MILKTNENRIEIVRKNKTKISVYFKSKSPHHSDTCLRAQEKLHPTCAKSPDLIDLPPSNGASYTSIQPACHTIAEMCRGDANCR